MRIHFDEVNKGYLALRQVAVQAFKQGDLTKALQYVQHITNILGTWNWVYQDEALEDLLGAFSQELCTEAYPQVDASAKRAVFCDQFEGSFVLSVQYIKGLLAEGYEVLYLLSDAWKCREDLSILPWLRTFDQVKVLVIDKDLSYSDKARRIYQSICAFNPNKLFVHTRAFSTFNLVLPQVRCTKYYIDLGDHSFWLGARHVDYVLPYRPFGAVIDMEKRGFRREQILLLPYYPIQNTAPFAGFPKEVEGKVVIFTGGDFYKTIDSKGTYWHLVRQILLSNPQAVVLSAIKTGKEIAEPFVRKFIEENHFENRFIPIGFRNDINEVFAHCDIYLATSPMSGGLMCQYAASNAKPILQYYPPKLCANNETEQVICFNDRPDISFTDEKRFLQEAAKLIQDEAYRKAKGAALQKAMITEPQFNALLAAVLRDSKSPVQWTPYPIPYNNITAWWMEIEQKGFSHLVPYLYGLLKKEHLLRTVPKMRLEHFSDAVFNALKKLINNNGGGCKYIRNNELCLYAEWFGESRDPVSSPVWKTFRAHIHPRRWVRLTRDRIRRTFFVLDFYLVPDALALKRKYKKVFGHKLNLKNPQTFNEKIQWLKLHDRKPAYKRLTDKIEVKKHVAKIIGEQYIIPTLGSWRSFDEIDFDSLPNQFVLKCNHDAASTIIVRDKRSFDWTAAKEKLTEALRDDYYMYNRQWAYKGIDRKILAEKFMCDNENESLVDYKFFCFNGEVDCVMLCLGRGQGRPKFYFFDKEWNLKRYNYLGKNSPEGFTIPKPEGMDAMFDMAARLSVAFPFVRVDLYNIHAHPYFGELTFYPDGGFDNKILPETELYFGEKIVITKNIAL